MLRQKVSFDEYLVSMVGEKIAKEILSMTKEEKENKCIFISARQGPTGKTALAQVLQKHGYKTVEAYESINIVLDQPIQKTIPNFASLVN